MLRDPRTSYSQLGNMLGDETICVDELIVLQKCGCTNREVYYISSSRVFVIREDGLVGKGKNRW